MKKRYWLGLAVSGLLLYLMSRQVDITGVARAFGQANLAFLLPALALYFGGVVVRAVRWAVLLMPVRRVGVGRLFVVLVIGFMANDLLPLRAGEGVRAFMLWRQERLEPGATLATIVVERLLDGLALVAFILVAGLLVPLESWLNQLAWVATGIFALGVAAVLGLALVPSPILSIAEAVLAPLPARVRGLGVRLLTTFVDGLSVLRSGPATAAVLALSLAAWLLEASMYYVLMFSFPFQPRFIASILGTAVANLASMVPSSPGYVGTFDLSLMTVLAGSFGVDATLAAAYTGLVHASLLIPVILLGLFFVWRGGLTLKGIVEEGALARQQRRDPLERVAAVQRIANGE